jgi:FKBP-type peptidyl-prolyl cis-trans isomerase
LPVPTNKQRQSTRAQLQRQLEQRRTDEARRRKRTLVISVVATVVLIVGVVVGVVVATSGSDNPTKPAAAGSTVTFKGVTVGNATDLKSAPKVSSMSSTDPAGLEVKDLVVGTGQTASPTSSVSVQYTGVLYKDGTEFDSSWSKGGQPVTFSLAQVVAGFTQGIGGSGTAAPMKVGGRRIIIVPASMGYGAQANGTIPANSSLVFVVDLVTVTS